MCIFHLADDHDGSSFSKMVHYAQLIGSKEVLSELSEEESFRQPDDSGIHFLEYEFDSERGGDILVTLEDPSCAVLTRNQQNVKSQGAPSSFAGNFKGKEIFFHSHNNDLRAQEIQLLKPIDTENYFDIVEFCKSS